MLVLRFLPLEEHERRLGGVVHSARAVVIGLGGLHATGLLGLLVIDLEWTSARVRSVCLIDHCKFTNGKRCTPIRVVKSVVPVTVKNVILSNKRHNSQLRLDVIPE